MRSNSGPLYSAFSNYAGASTVAYVVNLNLNSSISDAEPNPAWNNLNTLPTPAFTMSNLTNTLVQPTGLNFNIVKNFDGFNGAVGITTGNNSGIVPDTVMSTLYYVEFGDSSLFSISGLSQTNIYNFQIFAGTTYNVSTTSVYISQNQSASLVALKNTSNVASLYNLRPDSSGTITVKIKSLNSYGFINSLSIQGMPLPANVAQDSILTSGGGGQLNAKNVNNISRAPASSMLAAPSETLNTLTPDVRIAPNPFVDNITVKFDFKENVSNFTVQVVDINGRVVHRQEFSNVQKGTWQQSIQLDRSLAPGTYFIQLLGVPGLKTNSYKLLKSRF